MKKYILILLLSVFVNQLTLADHGLEGALGGSYSFNFANSSLVLAKNRWLFQYYTDYRFFRTYSEHQLEEIHKQGGSVINLKSTWGTALRFSYGLSNRITLSTQLPFAWVNADRLKPDSAELHRNSLSRFQHGDFSLLANYLLYNNKKSLWQAGIIAGIELPTGYTTEEETNIISGSGSFDPMMGLVISKRWERFKLTGNAIYKLTTKNHHGLDNGDYLYYQLVGTYALKKDKNENTNASDNRAFCQDSCACAPGIHWLLSVGFTGENLAKQKTHDETFANTGFHRNYATIGITAAVKNWAFSVGTEWTIAEKLNGFQNHLNGRVLASIALYL